ncbi:DUF4179 domain-containing protein [Neobacillus mesonae]|uniref:DUF4179 domain-containing protein n=1 Tax=Neobacillus mesonae TaxID=1193713 RepID=UPI00203D2DD8|nr:DUF4179 domain-containing protein [Neobacillus mesonae]MCM3569698.1 DUF4179 domain-containing protein [Neobacillus mesonae]
MEKKLFHDQYEKIEVPRDQVVQAIKTGVRRANSKKKLRKKRVIFISTAAAAGLFISSSFMFPSFSKVMADMPVVGYLYKDSVGEKLAAQKLITKLNETVSVKGIDVTVTSAYYDGAVMGVTFDVKGKVKTEKDGRIQGFYEIFNGDKTLGETKEVVYMNPTETGFTGKIQLSYPKAELPADTTFPLEFRSIGDKKGSWRFDVPVKQLPFETKAVNQERTREGMKVHFDSIITGQASTAVNYSFTHPKEGKYDDIRFEFFDDNGRPIHWLSDTSLEKNEKGNQVTIKGRTIIPQALKGKTRYIEVQPAVSLSEPNQFVSLTEAAPVRIQSSRQDLSVTIEKVSYNNKHFMVDFQINNGHKMGMYDMFYKDFARNDIILVKETRKDIFEEPIKHKVKVLNEKQLRFRSTFDISGLSHFSPQKYVLRVNLGSMAVNMPQEMEPVKINLE